MKDEAFYKEMARRLDKPPGFAQAMWKHWELEARNPASETFARLPTWSLAVPANKWQSLHFWGPLLRTMAWRPRRIYVKTGANVDNNQNSIVMDFLGLKKMKQNTIRFMEPYADVKDDSEYLVWIEDDVSIDPRSIPQLIQHRVPIIGGVYHKGSAPFSPLVFVKNKEGPGYVSVLDWEPDTLIEVDALGMGLVAVHREVYEKMYDELVVVQNHREAFRTEHPKELKKVISKSDKVIKKGDLPDFADFPFYCHEYSRTSDFYWYEMAKKLGYSILVDTTVQAIHVQLSGIGREEFLEYLEAETSRGRHPDFRFKGQYA